MIRRGGKALLSLVLLAGCGAPGSSAPQASGETLSYSCRLVDSYNYWAPAPYAAEPVEESYYDDVLLAGDSRMGSLALYGTHPGAEIKYVTSLNLLLIDTMPLDENEEGDDTTLMNVLQDTAKNNIYLLFGINEIRNSNFDAFFEQYRSIVEMLRQNNADVNVYIILAYHPDEITDLPEPALSEHLQMLNEGLIQIAADEAVYYLDTDNGLDENGTIRDEYVWDGLHFNPDGAHAFEDYIATHVVRREKYVQEICE